MHNDSHCARICIWLYMERCLTSQEQSGSLGKGNNKLVHGRQAQSKCQVGVHMNYILHSDDHSQGEVTSLYIIFMIIIHAMGSCISTQSRLTNPDHLFSSRRMASVLPLFSSVIFILQDQGAYGLLGDGAIEFLLPSGVQRGKFSIEEDWK